MGCLDNEEYNKIYEALGKKFYKYCYSESPRCKNHANDICLACIDNLNKQRRELSPDLLDINIPPMHWEPKDKEKDKCDYTCSDCGLTEVCASSSTTTNTKTTEEKKMEEKAVEEKTWKEISNLPPGTMIQGGGDSREKSVEKTVEEKAMEAISKLPPGTIIKRDFSGGVNDFSFENLTRVEFNRLYERVVSERKKRDYEMYSLVFNINEFRTAITNLAADKLSNIRSIAARNDISEEKAEELTHLLAHLYITNGFEFDHDDED